jgi:hypothetical protein
MNHENNVEIAEAPQWLIDLVAANDEQVDVAEFWIDLGGEG